MLKYIIMISLLEAIRYRKNNPTWFDGSSGTDIVILTNINIEDGLNNKLNVL